MKLGRLISLAALAPLAYVSGLNAADKGSSRVTVLKDLAYVEGKDADPRHKLDLYLPKDGKNVPVVVLVHGGAWMYGSKDVLGLYGSVGRFLAENGVAAALPNYRLSPKVKHPEHIKDVARAFAWVHAHIARHGGDPTRLFVGGHSAGGHLAALLATDDSYLKAEGLTRRSIRGVAAVSGVYRIPDAIAFDVPPLGPMTGGQVNLGFNPFDFVFDKDPEGRKKASPIAYVAAGLPPFLVVWAERDLPLLPRMAEDFVAALKAKGNDVVDLRAKDRQHSTVMFRATSADDPVGKALLSFVEKHGR